MIFSGCRKHSQGYEVSTRGDRRFSALVATLPDGRTIEEAYQLDVKGYRKVSDHWMEGKGKPPLDPKTDLEKEYLALWSEWAEHNPALMADLRLRARSGVLTDMFASGPISQAKALAEILNRSADALA